MGAIGLGIIVFQHTSVLC